MRNRDLHQHGGNQQMKHSVLRDSLLSGAFVSLVVLASPIRAQDAGQKLDIQLLPPIQGKSYDMPAGDFSAEVKAKAAARLRLVPRRTLNPDQLKRIKAGGF